MEEGQKRDDDDDWRRYVNLASQHGGREREQAADKIKRQ